MINAISVVVIIAAVVVMLIVVFTPNGQAPRIFGYQVLRITTGSMAPTYKEDTLIFIKRIDGDKIQVGDVVSFHSADPALDGALNTHRVTQITKTEDGRTLLTTKGDANNVEDMYLVDVRSVIGIVFGSSLILGKLCRLLANPLIFVPFIILPLVIMMVRNFVQAIRSARTLAKEEEEELIRKTLKEYEGTEKFRKQLEQRRKEDEQLSGKK